MVFLASLLMFWMKDVTLNTSRGFDDNNRQLKALAIEAYKEKFDDIKIKQNMKGQSNTTRLVDSHSDKHRLKRRLMRTNTRRIRMNGFATKPSDVFAVESGYVTDQESASPNGTNEGKLRMLSGSKVSGRSIISPKRTRLCTSSDDNNEGSDEMESLNPKGHI